MTIIEQISNPYLGSIVLGLIYGLTFCSTTCLPYIVSYIAGINAGFREGTTITLMYNSGRILAYAIIGSIIGLFTVFFDDSFLSVYQQIFSMIFGLVILTIGINIFFKRSKKQCKIKAVTQQENYKKSKRFDIRAFSMGFTKGLVLCPALLALLLYSITQINVNLTLIAILFGLGTTISPMLFLGGVAGWLFEKAPLFRKWTSTIGAALLILLGSSALIFATIEIL
jgi:thiol:disulfide interchange protein DsbD